MRREAICWTCITLWLPAIVAEIPIYTKPPDVDVDDILPGEKPTHYKPLIEQLFASFDKDNSGELDADEFSKVTTLKMTADDGVETDVWAASKYKRVDSSHWLEKLDKDDSETLTVDEAYMLLEKFVDVMAKAEADAEERKKNATEEAEMEAIESTMEEDELESKEEL